MGGGLLAGGGCDDGVGGGGFAAGGGATATAAAAAYLNGGSVAWGREAGGKPALRILAIGCCAKFGFGGGFAAVSAVRRWKKIPHALPTFSY